MTNQEILTKAIQKAGGFDISVPHFAHPLEQYEWDDERRYWYLGDITIPLFEIIYQHSFAKALWPKKGSGVYEFKSGKSVDAEHWKYHLSKMVIADDPIKYLGENLD